MNIKNFFYSTALICAFGATSLTFALDKIDAQDFVDKVSAKALAETENAKLALDKSTSTDIKAFAKKIISDHSAIHVELAGIASRKNLELADDETIGAKAKTFILDQRDGQSFDEAYARNQVKAHKDIIELYERAAASEDPDIAVFAKSNLSKLRKHLKEAEELAAAHDGR